MPPAEHSIILEGQRIPYRLTLREHQRHIYIRITGHGLLSVSAPWNAGMPRICAALTGRSAWILEHMKAVRVRMDSVNPRLTVMYCGITYEVVLSGTARRKPALDRLRAVLTVPSQDGVESWLRGMADRIIRFRTGRVSRETGIPFRTLSLRNQRTRWGSSSSRGTISINWRIVMAPPEVQRYLIIHELVHQLHQNHSKAYWKKVAEFCPDYRKHSAWLKQYSHLNSLFREDERCVD